jgi:hypothetical protein
MISNMHNAIRHGMDQRTAHWSIFVRAEGFSHRLPLNVAGRRSEKSLLGLPSPTAGGVANTDRAVTKLLRAPATGALVLDSESAPRWHGTVDAQRLRKIREALP